MITEEEKIICIRAIRDKHKYLSSIDSVNQLQELRARKAIRVLMREGYDAEVFEALL